MTRKQQRSQSALIDSLHDTSPESAAVVVPLLLRLTGARSVLDVGCGVGAWLTEFQRAGVSDCLGVDALATEHHPTLPEEQFRRVDLTQGFELNRSFELAICLEVAEHLPAASTDRLIATLTAAAPVVVFSAAVPLQGGEGHVNEQWPDHWHAKFGDHGYECHDVLRPAIWFDDRVAWWYRQNTYVYARRGWKPLGELEHRDIDERVIHPALFEIMAARRPDSYGIAALLRALPRTAARAIRTRIG